jgi:hypothetical protein
VEAESEVSGCTRGAQKMISNTANADGTINAVIDIPYTYPNGREVTVTYTIVNSDLTTITKKETKAAKK